MAKTLHCNRCDTDQAPEQFYDSPSNRWCRTCTRAYNARHRFKGQTPRPPAKGIAMARAANFTGTDTAHELAMLAHGEQIVRDCQRPWFAIQIITDGWAAMNRART